MQILVGVYFLFMLTWNGPEDVPQPSWTYEPREIIAYQERPPSMCPIDIPAYRTPH